MTRFQIESNEFRAIMDALKDIQRRLDDQQRRLDENPRKKRIFNEYVDNYEACRLLKVCRKTMERYRVEGSIPYTRIKQRIFYKLSDLEKFLEAGLIKPKPSVA